MARAYRGRAIPATPPDRTERWTVTEGQVTYELRADFWEERVLKALTKEPVIADPVRFGGIAVYDPRCAAPLLLAIRPALSGADARGL